MTQSSSEQLRALKPCTRVHQSLSELSVLRCELFYGLQARSWDQRRTKTPTHSFVSLLSFLQKVCFHQVVNPHVCPTSPAATIPGRRSSAHLLYAVGRWTNTPHRAEQWADSVLVLRRIRGSGLWRTVVTVQGGQISAFFMTVPVRTRRADSTAVTSTKTTVWDWREKVFLDLVNNKLKNNNCILKAFKTSSCLSGSVKSWGPKIKFWTPSLLDIPKLHYAINVNQLILQHFSHVKCCISAQSNFSASGSIRIMFTVEEFWSTPELKLWC